MAIQGPVCEANVLVLGGTLGLLGYHRSGQQWYCRNAMQQMWVLYPCQVSVQHRRHTVA